MLNVRLQLNASVRRNHSLCVERGSMDLTMVDLGLLADPFRCSEAEPAALEVARFFAELPAHFDLALPEEQLVARTEFIRSRPTGLLDRPDHTRSLNCSRAMEIRTHQECSATGPVEMPPYEEKHPVGARVRVETREHLESFRAHWAFHHPLEPAQLEWAGHSARVAQVGYYHGGDVLYQLEGVPGIWHEDCLSGSVEHGDREPPVR